MIPLSGLKAQGNRGYGPLQAAGRSGVYGTLRIMPVMESS